MLTSRKVVLGAALRTGNLAANAAVSLLMMPFVVRILGDRVSRAYTGQTLRSWNEPSCPSPTRGWAPIRSYFRERPIEPDRLPAALKLAGREGSREPRAHRPLFRTVIGRMVGEIRLPKLGQIFFRDFAFPSVYHLRAVSLQVIATQLILF